MKIHIVQKGDTLWELSKQYGVDFEALKQANPQLASPDMIMPGMKIKIPSNSKAVKKETAPAKETQKKEIQKKETQHPYQDHTPKPMPVMEEDDHKKKMIAKPEMPVQPLQPMHAQPIMEQEFQNYTTINFPQMPQHHAAKKEKSGMEHEKEKIQPMPMPKPKEHVKPEAQPMQQPPFQAMPYPMPQAQPIPQPEPMMQQQPMEMMPLCCHVMHPCYPQKPFPIMVNPEWLHPAQQMQPGMPCGPCEQMPNNQPATTMNMQVNPMHMAGNNDCGCQEIEPMHPFNMHADRNDQHEMNQQMSYPLQVSPPGNMYPPQFTDNVNHHSPYPNPPAYPNHFNTENQDSTDVPGE